MYLALTKFALISIRGLNSTKSEPYNVPLYEGYFEFLLDGWHCRLYSLQVSKALSGYDVSYARTFKMLAGHVLM